MSENDWLPLRSLLKSIGQPHDEYATRLMRQRIRYYEKASGRRLLSGKPLGCRVSELKELLPSLFVKIDSAVERKILSDICKAVKALTSAPS